MSLNSIRLAPGCSTQGIAWEKAGRGYPEVGWEEGASDGGIHEDEVGVAIDVHDLARQDPAHGAPVVAFVGVVLEVHVGRHFWQARQWLHNHPFF